MIKSHLLYQLSYGVIFILEAQIYCFVVSGKEKSAVLCYTPPTPSLRRTGSRAEGACNELRFGLSPLCVVDGAEWREGERVIAVRLSI